jgi:hypothetical protein
VLLYAAVETQSAKSSRAVRVGFGGDAFDEFDERRRYRVRVVVVEAVRAHQPGEVCGAFARQPWLSFRH